MGLQFSSAIISCDPFWTLFLLRLKLHVGSFDFLFFLLFSLSTAVWIVSITIFDFTDLVFCSV